MLVFLFLYSYLYRKNSRPWVNFFVLVMAARAWFTICYALYNSVFLKNGKFLAFMQLLSLRTFGFSRVS